MSSDWVAMEDDGRIQRQNSGMGGTEVAPRRVWLTLHGEEIVELKQVMMDRDVEGARALFHRVVVPRVREAADRRGMMTEGEDDRLPR